MPATVITNFKSAVADLTHAASCSDSGCALSLTDAPRPYVLLQVDDPHNPPPEVGGQNRCDYLFIGGDDGGGGPWVVPIELTAGRSKSGPHILAQLNGGLAVADARLPTGIKFRFRPILAYGRRGINRAVSDYLRKRSSYITFRGKSSAVQPVSCGSDLGSAL